jgi:hypothetical protein
MPKALDPMVVEVLKKYGEDARSACWDCHGTWVVLHKALERVAVKAGVKFDPPQVLTVDAANKTVAICVNGTMDGRAEWSIGEAAPYNNKNAYPFAIAEKRAKDRVILKLVGLHGLLYSEDEADGGKWPDDLDKAKSAPVEEFDKVKNPPGRSAVSAEVREHIREFNACGDGDTLLAYINSPAFKKFAFRVCCDYPNDWLGPEDNSGLSGSLASVAEQLGCGKDVLTYISNAELKRAEHKSKAA